MELMLNQVFRLLQDNASGAYPSGIYRVIFDERTINKTVCVCIQRTDSKKVPHGGRKKLEKTKRPPKKAPPTLIGELIWMERDYLERLQDTKLLIPVEIEQEVMKSLKELPKLPRSMEGIPPHVAMHWLMSLRDFHMPGIENCRLHDTVDLMVRQNYRYLDPSAATTWATVSGEKRGTNLRRAPMYCAAAAGISGTGKSEAIGRCFRTYPSQVIQHESFPRLEGSHLQICYLSVNVPGSGRSVDLATDLMREHDRVTGSIRFASEIAKDRRDGMKMLDSWRQVATAHFLGALHLDEIQNLFKLATLKRRNKRTGVSEAPELSIVEDQLLKWILTLLNTWQVPLIVSGTFDGMAALTRRLSTTERIVTSGYHQFHPFESAKDSNFRINFLPELGRYQFVKKPLPVEDELADLIIELTGGVQRLIIALWISAQRLALERGKGDLLLTDFRMAAATYLAPIAPAVAAIRSKDPAKMSKYEDLMPRDNTFWTQFWGSVSQM